MSRLLNQLQNNVLVADGAMGTILYSEGLDTCPEAYNLTHPEKVESIHRSYIEAGADIIQTNTYGANFEKLRRFGLEHKVKDIHKAAVAIAKRAARPDTFILGTVGGFRSLQQENCLCPPFSITLKIKSIHSLKKVSMGYYSKLTTT